MEIDETRARKEKKGREKADRTKRERDGETGRFYYPKIIRAETETKIHATSDVYICQRK